MNDWAWMRNEPDVIDSFGSYKNKLQYFIKI